MTVTNTYIHTPLLTIDRLHKHTHLMASFSYTLPGLPYKHALLRNFVTHYVSVE